MGPGLQVHGQILTWCGEYGSDHRRPPGVLHVPTCVSRMILSEGTGMFTSRHSLSGPPPRNALDLNSSVQRKSAGLGCPLQHCSLANTGRWVSFRFVVLTTESGPLPPTLPFGVEVGGEGGDQAVDGK